MALIYIYCAYTNNNRQYHAKGKGHPMISLCRQRRQRYRSKTFANLVLVGVGYSAASPRYWYNMLTIRDCGIWLVVMPIHGFWDSLWCACLSTKPDDGCLISGSASDIWFSDKKVPCNRYYTVIIHQFSVLESQFLQLFFAVASPHL